MPDTFWLGNYVNTFIEIGWMVVPWTFALGAVCRAEMTITAARELRARRAEKGALASA